MKKKDYLKKVNHCFFVDEKKNYYQMLMMIIMARIINARKLLPLPAKKQKMKQILLKLALLWMIFFKSQLEMINEN